MRYYQYFWECFTKYKWFVFAIVFCSATAAALFCFFATPLYESSTEIYPLVMAKHADTIQLNPCYQIRRIVHAEQFRKGIIQSGISSTLSEKNYDKRISYHETPRHTMVINIRDEVPHMADSLAWQFLKQIDVTAKHLTSLRLSAQSDFSVVEQVQLDYYNCKSDFVDDVSYHSENDTAFYFLFDLISAPSCVKTPVYPPDLLKTTVLVFVISSFLSLVGVCLMAEIRKRLNEPYPVR